MRTLFKRRRAGAQLDAELRDHLERQIEENCAAGMSPEEARYAALRTFGNPALVREQTRAVWSWGWLESLGRELRYGMRGLSRAPGFTLVAVVVMALCIGSATALFTVVRSILLRPLPFQDPGRLVMVYEHLRAPQYNVAGFNYNVVSPADFLDWRAETHGFADMAAWRNWRSNIVGQSGELPEMISAAAGSWNLFPLLGVKPVYGRTFTENEDGPGHNVVMLTWSLFERRFAANPGIVGQAIHLDGKPYVVVGVLPRDFAYPDSSVQLWVPYSAVGDPAFLRHHDWHQSHVIARLRPNVSLANALAQVEAVQYRLHLQYPGASVAEDAVARSITEDLARNVKKPLLILMCAVGCMLLIGCLNVANLLVARGAARQREAAVREALGAGRMTLLREQLVESLLICVAGGAAGMALSVVVVRWLMHAWKQLPSAKSIHVDGVVLAFACGLVFATALIAGLAPALSSGGSAILATLQSSSRNAAGGHRRTRLRKSLLAIEISVTVILLVAAGLLLKSFVRLRGTEIGCNPENLLTLHYSLPDNKYDTPQKVNAFNESLQEGVRRIPGVRAVALGTMLPATGWNSNDTFQVAEHPPTPPGVELPDALLRYASPDYFRALEIPLLSGRFFTADDRLNRGYEAIISHSLARQYFPGENPIGRHLVVPSMSKTSYEIVGVVGDTLWRASEPVKPTMYFPLLDGLSDCGFALAVRTISDPLASSVPVQKQFAAIDSQLPVADVLTMDQVIGQSLGNQSFSATLVLAFAVLSLLLAAVGLYGVLSYLTAQRMTEIGVRIALGAQREQVLRLMLADGLGPALLGLVLGLGAAAAAVRLIQSVLYETEPLDPLVFAAVAATLLMVAIAACLTPAWRASRLDPIKALRTE